MSSSNNNSKTIRFFSDTNSNTLIRNSPSNNTNLKDNSNPILSITTTTTPNNNKSTTQSPHHLDFQLSPSTLQNTRKFSLNKDILISMINNSSSSATSPSSSSSINSPSSSSSSQQLNNNFSSSNNLFNSVDPDSRRRSSGGENINIGSGNGSGNNNASVNSLGGAGNNSVLFLNLDERLAMQTQSELNSSRPINHQRNRHKGSGGISEYSFTVDDLILPNSDISSPRLAISSNLNSNIVSSNVSNAKSPTPHSKSNSTTTATFVPYISPLNTSNSLESNELGTTEFVNLDLTSILPHGKLLRFFLVNNQDYFTDTVQLRKHSPVIAQEIDFQQRLNEFENQNTGFFSDISIRFVPSGREIRAHKFILSMYSPVLATLFSSRWKETHDNVIEVLTEVSNQSGGVNFEEVDDEQLFVEMILCMYSGQIYQVEQHLIVPLLELSDKYQFTELSRACEEYLRVHLNEHNCISLLYLANGISIENTLQSSANTRLSISSTTGSKYSKGKFDRLKERALAYIDTHFELVSKTKAFLFLDVNMLIFLLNRGELRVDSEDVILSAILNWCDGDLCNRRELLFSTLLEHVRLYHLSPNRLAHLGEVLERYTGTLENSSLMMPWMNRIMQAMSYQMSHTLGFQLSQSMQQKIALECPPRKRATQDITRISNLLSQEQFLQIAEWINEQGKQGLMKDVSERFVSIFPL